jgi:hypothetical protein
MSSRKILAIVVVVVVSALGWAQGLMAQTAPAQARPADPWPRELKLSKGTVVVYQPQIDSWKGDRLDFRAVLAVTPKGTKKETFGVVWGTARTHVDRIERIVTLEDMKLTKSKFPTLPDNGASYRRALQQESVPAQRTISLDRMEAMLAETGSVKPHPVQVNNHPPRIIIAQAPAILVAISGNPIIRPVPGTNFDRVINTELLILRQQGSNTYYLHVYDGWVYSGTLPGPWYEPMVFPSGIDKVAQDLAKSGQVDLLDGGKTQPKLSLSKGIPAIYVSETPTELLIFQGQPHFTPISGTGLQWATNTTADVIFDSANSNYYALISGRWYQSPALTETGPWNYIASNRLPSDFRRIPVDEPAGVVLASVAGTPQAEEAIIENSIPQTATIERTNGPKFSPVFDGAPKFEPVSGTPLQYVVNSPTPLIRVDAHTYYALTGGVWFVATAPNGPWVVATSVPAVIYTIPPSSSLYYVTYVRVYGSSAKVVYVGYTPGYLGTVIAPDGVVVYGTGYVYQPWVGTVYYPPPVTYGIMAQPVYNPAVGMAFGFAMGAAAASIASSYYHPYYYPTYYHPAYYPHYYGHPCCGSTSYNTYGQWGRTAYSGTRTYYNNYGGSYGTSTSGHYTNYATGTTGTYSGNRSYNPYSGQAKASSSRTFDTPYGASGSVSHSAKYNPYTGKGSYSGSGNVSGPRGGSASGERSGQVNLQSGNYSRSGSASATGPGGRSGSVSGSTSGNIYSGGRSGEVTRSTSNQATGLSRTTTTSAGSGESPSRTTTVTNTNTGQSRTHSTGEAYADKQGNVYRNSSSGWQQHTSSGWQSARGDTSWADKEQQARSQGEDRFNNFSQGRSSSGWSQRSSGGWSRGGGFGGGGGWADRFGGGGGFGGGRFGGGGFGGGRFGGGGFGGFRGRR